MPTVLSRSLVQEGRRLLRPLRSALRYLELPPAAKRVRRRDRAGLPAEDPGIDRVLEETLGWLVRAQDRSQSKDGGVARHFSLVTGWSPSYPETTGYIVPTVLTLAEEMQSDSLRRRARGMLDWLVQIQLPEGGFQGGTIDARPRVPVTFNTGQILIGLARGARLWPTVYRDAMRRAADWLVATQDPDGAWRRCPSPFAEPGEKTYDTHVAWGLVEAGTLDHDSRYIDRAAANVRWALRHQQANGWLASCCLTDPSQPLTHTLGYALRGILEVFRVTREPLLLDRALRMADGLLQALRSGGRLPGRIGPDWNGTVPWVCLTGSSQIAACWLILHEEVGDPRFLRAACDVNRYVRRTIEVDGPDDVRGGVKGSFPIDAEYGTYQYLNWAAKFCLDANLMERAARRAPAEV